MADTYPALQLDALREVANIGSGTAATALSQLLGRPVDISVPAALAVPMAELVDALGSAEDLVVTVALPVDGELTTTTLLLLKPSDAIALCKLCDVEPDSLLGRSALAETGNILGSAYLGALTQMTQLALEPRPPEVIFDMLGAVVASVLAPGLQDTDIALLLDSELAVDHTPCSLSFVFAPGTHGVHEILGRLGLDP